ncbi:MAG: alpha/beta hydrolase [Croceibacterium sp.]
MRAVVLALLALLPTVPAAAETAARLVPASVAQAQAQAVASYGPFRVLDARTVALVDVTDAATPGEFRAMLKAYPALTTLRFVECPGTYDDGANLALGRAIRRAGLATEVPAGGSVRSGGVELVLAGVTRTIDDRAEFAVHAWEDDDGLEATDYRADSPENLKYLAYYREMGLADPQAFYAMTNSVPFENARWLDGAEMRGWIRQGDADRGRPQLAYLDLGGTLN